MEAYESLREKRSHHSRRNPSFSSNLLDAIYRSIDDECGNRGEELILYREAREALRQSCNFREPEHKETANERRACRVDKWGEKKLNEKARRTWCFEEGFGRPRRENVSMIVNSASSSSESSFGGFSSSETESSHGLKSSFFTSNQMKSIRIGSKVAEKPLHSTQIKTHLSEIYISPTAPKDRQKTKLKEGFIKSKSRVASKIYGELKKARQPISPGARLASFLNSLFAAGNSKKAKISASITTEELNFERKPKYSQASTCSSASSYSRSCLSSGKSSNGTKRSVRFYPVSIIFDEDCRPCGQKCLSEDDRNQNLNIGEDLRFHLREKTKRVEEVAKDLLKEYQKKTDFLGSRREFHKEDYDDDDDNDNDDDLSDSSSDLFELKNFTATGIERYREELPVYETTNLDANRAIASSLIL